MTEPQERLCECCEDVLSVENRALREALTELVPRIESDIEDARFEIAETGRAGWHDSMGIARLYESVGALRDLLTTLPAEAPETTEALPGNPECGSCHGDGWIGWPPDDFWDCPECVTPAPSPKEAPAGPVSNPDEFPPAEPSGNPGDLTETAESAPRREENGDE